MSADDQPVGAVNLLWCVPGEVGGSEEYLVRQLLGLVEASEFRPQVFCRSDFAAAHPELGGEFDLVEAPDVGGSRPARIALEHSWLAARTRRAAFVHHGGGTRPKWGNRTSIVTLHDLQFLTFPDYFRPAKLRYLSAVVPRSLRAATTITVPTSYVRETVVEAYGIDPDRIVVVPHGVEPTLGTGATASQALRDRYGLGDRRIVVFPAITHPHKGHRFLLRLLAERWSDADLALVLLGGAGIAEPDVRADIERLGLVDRVVRPGRVPAADRDGLLQMADALAFPSEYEGFGAPIIEAMALGTPVICSDQPAVVEVAGGAALSAPLDLDAWAPLLSEARARRAELVAAGTDRAAAFTAMHSGAALADAYRRTLSAT